TTPPALDGSWKGWESVPVITFGLHQDQIRKSTLPDENYSGPNDVTGKFRLMWDDKFLYLGVEALDDVFVTQPERGKSGFMGDSIEFAFQPDNLMTQQAPRYEFELYLPDGKPPYAASRRFPLDKAGMIDTWMASVTPTGKRADVNYQVAIPWSDLGVEKPSAGKTISFALVLNDCDTPGRLGGGRGRILWFGGLDGGKNPEMYGDVTLVEP
ncbi:MAG: sugar-binding protein, partial [Victivallales bacterium]